MHVDMPVGSGGQKGRKVNRQSRLRKMVSIVTIKSNDELCMPRVTARAKVDNIEETNHNLWCYIRDGRKDQKKTCS
jgi:hypothetical protein